MTRVADATAVLERWYPTELAQDWDAVGLAVGSAEAEVRRIGLAVDCTVEVVAEAVAAQAELLVVHHPPFLRGLGTLDLRHPKARLAADLLRGQVAVYVAHTNADVAVNGVVDALADAVGLRERAPLRPAPGAAPSPPMDKIITFVPVADADLVIDALADAGAGRIGDYQRCAFTSSGLGTFTGGPGTTPYVGQAGRVEQVSEARVEMVLPRDRRRGVVEALLAAHPYETPAYDVLELAGLPSTEVGLGRVGRLPRPLPLAELARQVAAGLPATPRGVLVAGDPERMITTVAVQAGAGDDLLDDARQAGADVYVTSDLRHHPATEALAWGDAPALIDISHWAAEWTWLPVAERLVRAELDVDTYVSTLCTDAWGLRA